MIRILLSAAWAVLFLLRTAGSAPDDSPFLIHKSRSPDGKIEIWMKPDGEEGVASGTAQIRLVKTQRILGTFEWGGFGVRADADAFQVMWRHDSKFFAIKWEEARGWMTGAVHAQTAGRRWAEVKLPKDAYVSAIKNLEHVPELYGKGCDAPERWLDNGQLVLEFCDRNIAYPAEDRVKMYEVSLRVSDWRDRPLPMAQITTIKFAHDIP
jgi:hypothetical protein